MGIWKSIVGLFGYVMQFCYQISFDNYILALLFYALFFKILLLPFAIKQQKTQIKTALLRPKILKIEKKYGGRNDKVSQQKKQQEIMELQQREGASPLSGCLPLLLQFPIIIALYQIIREPLTYITRATTEQLAKLAEFFEVTIEKNAYYQLQILGNINADNISEVRNIVGSDVILPNMSLFGMNLGDTPSFKNFSILVIVPFLVFLAQYLQMKISRKFMAQPQTMTPEVQKSNLIMDIAMPALTLYFAFNFSAAIGIYWILQSLLALLQTFILSKTMPLPTFTDEEIKEMEKAEKKRMEEARAKKKIDEKSLHHIDDDDDDDVDIPYHSIYDDDGDDNVVVQQAPKSQKNQKNKNSSKK